jgi:hypothetical protein
MEDVMRMDFLTNRLPALALMICGWSSTALAQAPNEVIVYNEPGFQGASESFILERWMHQRVIDLPETSVGWLRSMKIGADVVVTGFTSLDRSGTAGGGLAEGMRPFADVPARYADGTLQARRARAWEEVSAGAITINRLDDMDSELGAYSVPFRVMLRHMAASVFGGEAVTSAEYVLLPETDHDERCVNLDSLGRGAGKLLGVDELRILAGRFGGELMETTAFAEYDCKGSARGFPGKGGETRYNMALANFDDMTRSVSLRWLGPKLPDAPSGSRPAPEAPGDRKAPEAPGDRRAPEAPGDPSATPAQPGDEVTRFRLTRKVGDRLHFEVDYRVSAAHGATVYAGARLHGSGRVFGGYLPVELPSIGEGMVSIELDRGGETEAAEEVEFFFFEGGQPAFISRRFHFVDSPTGQVTTPKLVVHDYSGCFKDSHQRDLQGFRLEDAAMTVNMCLSVCKERGFSVAALQFGSHCFCGDSFGRYGPATNCDMPCAGDANETCGGSWANGVFMVP